MKNVEFPRVLGAAGEYLPVDRVVSRWGQGSAAGFTAVPNALIHAQAKLKLSPIDMVVLVNLLSHWWYRRRAPFPSSSLVAKHSGLSVRTVQRSLNRLRKAGLIEKKRRREGGTEYELNGLREVTAEYAMAHEWRHQGREQRQAPVSGGDRIEMD